VQGRMMPLSWENWIDHYEARGFRVLAPAWPGMDGDIDELRRDPLGIEHLGIQEIVDHYDAIIRELDRPPIIMGHSFGGAFTQILLDRGLGAAGVAIDSAAVKGVLTLSWSTLKSWFPVLKSPEQSQGGRAELRGVPLRVHEHAKRGGVTGGLRALRRAGSRPRLVSECSGELQPARHDQCRFPQRRARTSTADCRRQGTT
jgi:pimeloyl-ACP methyl ester carboxylesterase